MFQPEQLDWQRRSGTVDEFEAHIEDKSNGTVTTWIKYVGDKSITRKDTVLNRPLIRRGVFFKDTLRPEGDWHYYLECHEGADTTTTIEPYAQKGLDLDINKQPFHPLRYETRRGTKLFEAYYDPNRILIKVYRLSELNDEDLVGMREKSIKEKLAELYEMYKTDGAVIFTPEYKSEPKDRQEEALDEWESNLRERLRERIKLWPEEKGEEVRVEIYGCQVPNSLNKYSLSERNFTGAVLSLV